MATKARLETGNNGADRFSVGPREIIILLLIIASIIPLAAYLASSPPYDDPTDLIDLTPGGFRVDGDWASRFDPESSDSLPPPSGIANLGTTPYITWNFTGQKIWLKNIYVYGRTGVGHLYGVPQRKSVRSSGVVTLDGITNIDSIAFYVTDDINARWYDDIYWLRAHSKRDHKPIRGGITREL
jgi:hypothetical protein